MKPQASGSSLILSAISLVLFVLPAAAQSPQATTTNAPAVTTVRIVPGKPAATTDKAAPEPGVNDILKMLDAGVSKDVLKAYVENSTVPYNLTSADVIALKEHGVTDDITVILLKRSAETRAQASQAPAIANAGSGTNAPARVVRYMNSANVDPESEDYFQYYYLYPRTLAYSYQTLGYPTAPYGYGFYGYNPYVPFGYGPRFGPGFGPRHFHH